MKQAMETSDQSLDRIEHNILTLTVILSSVAAWFLGLEGLSGAGIGGLLSYLNFKAIRSSVKHLLTMAPDKAPRRYYISSALKLVCIVFFLSITYFLIQPSILFLLIGFSLFIPSILWETVMHINREPYLEETISGY